MLREEMLTNYVKRFFYEIYIFYFFIMFFYNCHAAGCNVEEKLVASCDLPGEIKRTAAFCADKNNKIKYYFKESHAIKFKIEFNSERKLKRWLDLGTYTTYFGFNNASYTYVLGVPEEKPGALAFLEIKKNGKTISSKECSSNSFGEKNIESDSIEDVPDSVVRGDFFKFP